MIENAKIKQEELKKEIYLFLEKYRKCLLVCPTGFGKSYLMHQICSENKEFKKILMVTPQTKKINSNKRKFEKIFSNLKGRINYLSYSYFSRSIYKGNLLKDRIEKRINDIDLVIFDEAHRMGGSQCKVALDYLFEVFKGKIIGVTATPVRPDDLSISFHFFQDKFIEFKLKEAIEKEILNQPIYVITNPDKIRDQLNSIRVLFNNKITKRLKREIDLYDLEFSNLSNIFKRNITNPDNNINQNYMKFIVFYVTKERLIEDKNNIIEAFSNAFPNHIISYKIVVSGKGFSGNLKFVEKEFHKRDDEDRIDLIFSINQLNESFHCNDLTGIIMKRITFSNIIFSQETGRAYGSDITSQTIIFDLVYNYDRQNRPSIMSDSEKDLLKIRNSLRESESLGYIKLIDEIANFDTFNKRIIDSLSLVLEIITKGLTIEEAILKRWELGWEKEDIYRTFSLYYEKEEIDKIIEKGENNEFRKEIS